MVIEFFKSRQVTVHCDFSNQLIKGFKLSTYLPCVHLHWTYVDFWTTVSKLIPSSWAIILPRTEDPLVGESDLSPLPSCVFTRCEFAQICLCFGQTPFPSATISAFRWLFATSASVTTSFFAQTSASSPRPPVLSHVVLNFQASDGSCRWVFFFLNGCIDSHHGHHDHKRKCQLHDFNCSPTMWG